jgi:hypothetical protein
MDGNATQSETDRLFEEWVNRQDMTWAIDDASQAKLRGILERGMEAIRSRAGNPALSFEGENKSLLFDYCRYDLNNCRENFDTAFTNELTMLRLREGFGCGKDAVL